MKLFVLFLVCIFMIGCSGSQSATNNAMDSDIPANDVSYEKSNSLQAIEIADVVDGRDGRDGMDGADGVDGRDGVDGAQGEMGAQGPKGNDGSEGARGDKGDKGDPGVGIINALINEVGELILFMSDGSFINAGKVQQNITYENNYSSSNNNFNYETSSPNNTPAPTSTLIPFPTPTPIVLPSLKAKIGEKIILGGTEITITDVSAYNSTSQNYVVLIAFDIFTPKIPFGLPAWLPSDVVKAIYFSDGFKQTYFGPANNYIVPNETSSVYACVTVPKDSILTGVTLSEPNDNKSIEECVLEIHEDFTDIKKYKLNEQITFDKNTITVTSVDYVDQHSNYISPPVGKRFAIVSIDAFIYHDIFTSLDNPSLLLTSVGDNGKLYDTLYSPLQKGSYNYNTNFSIEYAVLIDDDVDITSVFVNGYTDANISFEVLLQ